METSILDENLGLAYVSCIEVDGKPILPPLMSEAKRAEMRNFRQLAIEKELRRQEERERRLRSVESSPVSGKEAFKLGCTFTSTPFVGLKEPAILSSTPLRSSSRTTPFFDDTTIENKTAVEVLDEEIEPVALAKFGSHFVIKNSTYVSPGQILDVPEMKTVIRILPENDTVPTSDDAENDSSSNSSTSGDNFPSAASSTGTFIIQSDPNKPLSDDRSEGEIVFEEDISEDEIESIKRDDEDEKDGNILQKCTSSREARKTMTPPLNRRKRPATYFDSSEEDEQTEKDPSELSKISSNTSLEKYLHSDVTWSSTLISSQNETSVTVGPTVPEEFEFRLTNEVPTSAENSPMSSKDEALTQSSEDSDKENQDKRRGKHIRKLSYTLTSPSALLLAAMNQDPDNTEAKSTTEEEHVIPIALSTIPSSNATPVKLILPAETDFVAPTPSNQELDKRLENLNRHLAELQLGMGLNKKKHLERYLGDTFTKKTEAYPITQDSDVQIRLKQLQENQERELTALAEKHRQQELKLKQEFESLRNNSIVLEVKGSHVIYEKRSPIKKTKEDESSYYVPPPQKNLENEENEEGSVYVENSPSKLSMRSSVSSKHSYYSSNSNPTPRERYYEQQLVSMTLTEGSESASTMSAANSIVNSGGQGHGQESVIHVGLSKLQTKMKSMSPSMFKVTQDTRSPLLKGVVFMRPLARPEEIMRIPAAVLHPSMKPKFDRVSAAVKGYLIRRLLNTETIQNLIQTIRDTVDILLKLYDEAPHDRKTAEFHVEPQEAELNRRLLQQLHGACASFHDVFFKLSIKERMAIIATDRNKIRAKAIKTFRNPVSPFKKHITTATLKSMERRFSVNPTNPGTRPFRKTMVPDRDNLPLHVPSRYVPPAGSQTVKAKPLRSYIVSPKRRRMTLYTSKSLQQLSKPNPTSDNTRFSRQTVSGTSSSSTVSFKVKPKASVASKKEVPGRSKKLDATYTTAKLTTAYRPRQSTAR